MLPACVLRKPICCLMVLLLHCVLPASAQFFSGLNKDSLKQVIAALPDDTNKVHQYITLGQQYEGNIPDSAIWFYKQANALSTKMNYPAGIIRYVNNITAVLNVQGKFDESLKLHQQALDICNKHQLDNLRIKVLLNIGAVYQLKEDYQAAADHYLKNLPVLERTADHQSLSLVYGNLVGLFRNLNQQSKAIVYAQKSMAHAERSKDISTIAKASNNMANALKDIGRDRERGMYLNKAYEIGKEINDIELQETALINLGDMLAATAPPDQYLPIYKKALPLADSLNDVYGKSLVLRGIAGGLFMKKQFRAAEAEARAALEYARANGQKETESSTLLLLSDIEIALGNLSASQRYRGEYDSVSTALVNEGLVKNVQELETKYEVEKKQSQILRQNLLLEQKNRQATRQRTLLLLSAAGILLMAFFILWGIRYYRQRQQLNKKEMEALQVEKENVRLKAQLEGQLQERQRISQEMHDDMGSGLTSMLFLSRTIQGQDEVASRIQQTAGTLSKKMNEIIWTMNHEHDTLDSMIAYMRLHMAETLDDAGIDYSFTVTDPLPEWSLSQEYRRNIYLCAREAVHNIVKHAKASGVSIHIQAGDQLEINITDNGKGMQAEKSAGFGNGLKNMQKRMQTIGGTFQITSGQTGTVVALTAPRPL